jgi:hypothetical protein
MLNSEKIAIAAHLHVLLRRKTGRVTDTEWMASNADYAAEIVRFARGRADSDGHLDLREWADKLESAMAVVTPSRSVTSRLLSAAGGPQTTVPVLNTTNTSPTAGANLGPRYVWGIR